MHIGLIGFGEASYFLTKGLDTKKTSFYAFDVLANANNLKGDIIRKRAAENGVNLVSSYQELFNRANIVLCLTSASSALPIAQKIKPFLRKEQYYADLNSASHITKKRISETLADSPAKFVDIAIMAPVPSWGSKVPLVACGEGAKALTIELNEIGMHIKYIGEEVGLAALNKMIRSVFMKGFVALLCETIFAASQSNMIDDVLESIKVSLYEEKEFTELVNLHLTGMVPHSSRFTHEMEEALITLEELGEDASMTKATIEKMRWFTEEGYIEEFASIGVERPNSYKEIIELYKRRLAKTVENT